MVSKSAVMERVRGKNLRTGKDFLEGIEDVLQSMVDEACKRALLNGRRTVRAVDIPAMMTRPTPTPPQEDVRAVNVTREAVEAEGPAPAVRKEVHIGRSPGGIIRRIG